MKYAGVLLQSGAYIVLENFCAKTAIDKASRKAHGTAKKKRAQAKEVSRERDVKKKAYQEKEMPRKGNAERKSCEEKDMPRESDIPREKDA